MTPHNPSCLPYNQPLAMFHFTENWDEWQGDYYEQDELQTEETNGKLRCTACLCGENLYKKLLLFYSFIFSFIFSFILVSEPHSEDPGFNVSSSASA